MSPCFRVLLYSLCARGSRLLLWNQWAERAGPPVSYLYCQPHRQQSQRKTGEMYSWHRKVRTYSQWSVCISTQKCGHKYFLCLCRYTCTGAHHTRQSYCCDMLQVVDRSIDGSNTMQPNVRHRSSPQIHCFQWVRVCVCVCVCVCLSVCLSVCMSVSKISPSPSPPPSPPHPPAPATPAHHPSRSSIHGWFHYFDLWTRLLWGSAFRPLEF